MKTGSVPRVRNLLSRGSLIALGLIPLAAAAGLASRRWGAWLPEFVALYAGDAMWALACFAFFRLILPSFRSSSVLLLTLAFSLLIELSQLWHPLWLDRIRQTLIGGLLLGFGFRGSDLLCYLAGALAGWGVFALARSRPEKL